MIRLCVDIEKAQKEFGALITDADMFRDCHFGNPHFDKWKEDIRLFLSRTYDAKESRDKWSTFSDIQFWSAEWSDYLSSIETITPENSGLDKARLILSAWKNDLSKRKGEHTMNRILRAIGILTGIIAAGGLIVFGVAYFNQSNQNIINTGSMGNISIGDNSMQMIEQK